LRAKRRLVLLGLIVSLFYSFFCPEFVRGSRFQFFIDTEPQLTICESASGRRYCPEASGKRKQILAWETLQ
jgi:hypothetical protein